MKCTWFLLALLATGLSARAADMYSWTDANGVKHFTDSPPPASVKAQRLKVKGGVTSNAPEESTTDPTPTKGKNTDLAAAAGYSPEDIRRNCEIAKQNLGVAEGQRVAKDAEGYPTDLEGAKVRQTQIDKANQQIKLFCTN